MGKMRNAYKTEVRKPKGPISHERTRHRWEDNIKNYMK
jgi:hypothetical protein